MSARQPFVPSRPASHTVAAQEDAANSSLAFAIDPNNPLHRDSSKPPISFMSNKPLNLSSFAKNDTSSQSHSTRSNQSPQASSKPLESIIRPATVDIPAHSNQHQNRRIANINPLKIVAPTPSSAFRSNMSSAMLAIDDSAFKLPTLPSSFAKPAPASANDSAENLARPLTPEPTSRFSSDLSRSDSHSMGAIPSSNSGSTLKTCSRASSCSPTLEQVRERVNEDKHADPQTYYRPWYQVKILGLGSG
jgi:hypothetical protein